MDAALLSRFDLVFILVDKADEQQDKILSEHVMRLHGGRKFNSPGTECAGRRPLSPVRKGSLKERLQSITSNQLDKIPLPLLRKYIAYAKRYVHPR